MNIALVKKGIGRHQIGEAEIVYTYPNADEAVADILKRL